ncbi:MAG TPA: 2-oxoglutarate dehydrogenase complex dihydrolipoyllysine-residue succinyltransferase [Woeseiaceae bacterium]|nr:2-oxoglutarate dehydrogenase complex dihydrolipoyllysine-residue succinyltransferase [Woeseiaceae bacterium]
MSIEVKVPQLPESVTDATLVSWHKQEGDRVSRDENLVDLETDKVVLEVPAPADGVLKEIKIGDGTTVTSGEVLALLEEGEGGAEPDTGGKTEPAAGEKEQGGEEKAAAAAEKPAGKGGAKEAAAEKQQERAEKEEKEEKEEKDEGGARKLSPSVRRMIEEHDLDPDAIEASGRGGRVTKADVQRHLESLDHDTAPEDTPAEADAHAAGGGRTEERVPMTRLRARIAERMVQAQQAAAMLTTFNEADMSAIMELRSRYKDRFADEHEVKLGFMSFFVRAAVEALRKFPVVNASVEDNDIIYHDYQDVGIAVSTERGLLVPILRDAGRMSLADIEKTINDYGRRAREGTLGIDDLTGGTFTITNGGIFGSMMSTPILNPPQSAILGMHAIQDRPMAVEGKVEIRPMMYLALTYDHRIIDGREAVQFLVSIKQSLEDPARLLLQV